MIGRRPLLLLLPAVVAAGVSGYLLAPDGSRDATPAASAGTEAAAARSLVAGPEQAAAFAASEAAHSYEEGSDDFVRTAAVSAMNIVQTNISPARYGSLAEEGKTPRDVSEVWATLAGICDDASDAYTSVMDELGVRTRRLEIYWLDPEGKPNSHVTIETWWGGEWHWLDPTYGVIYTKPGDPADVLSFREVRSGRSGELRVNESDQWWLQGQIDGPINVVGFVEWPQRKLLWFPVKRPSAEIPGAVRKLERLTRAEWQAPGPSEPRPG